MGKNAFFGINLGLLLGIASMGVGYWGAESARADEMGTLSQDQVGGFYSRDGRLQEAAQLPEVGVGFVKLFLPRDRAFGSTDLVGLIQEVAAALREVFPVGSRLQVGDLSAERGGKISLHSSHQNGLDVDLRFFGVDGREQDPSLVNGFDERFVRGGRVTDNFDREQNWELVSHLVGSGKVQRIFIDPAIKREFCRRAGTSSEVDEVLRRLRPYPNHDDHIHVRLYCPAGNPRCVSQAEVEAGTGCSRRRWRRPLP